MTADRVAGIDGCRAGWVAVSIAIDGALAPRMRVESEFRAFVEGPDRSRILAVDMPIGLPERSGRGGRGPEQAVRPHLGQRQSSVFSVPGRAAIFEQDYRRSCDVALGLSDPPRKVSKQAFNIFPKIREIDAVMTLALEERIFEVHPEFAFWRLNGERAMTLPKKVKSRANPSGLAERRDLLVRLGYPPEFFERPRPRGVGADDLIDAAACALIAIRIKNGVARPYPDDFIRDGKGLRAAIWA